MNGLSDAAAIVTAVAAAAAVAAGYVQFVLKRSVLPSAEFDVQFTPYVRGDVQLVGEVELIFKNVGSNMLVVTGVRSRIRYRLSTDAEATDFTGNIEPFFAGEVLPPPAVAGGHPSSSLPVSLPSWPPGPSASVAGGEAGCTGHRGYGSPGMAGAYVAADIHPAWRDTVLPQAHRTACGHPAGPYLGSI